MTDPNKLALQLNSEIAAVITAMRQNAKWAMVPGKYSEEDHMDPEPHYEDFRSLRRKVFEWSAGDWSNVHPLEYLTPFLKLIREPEVSGPITGVALTALCRLLGNNVVGRSTRGAADAINAIVEDTTQCKFEATNPASDEVVLFNILQVLQAVVKCDGGVYLSDDSVCKAYQAAFMLGNLDFDTRSKSKEVSELLTHYSRQIIGEMTSEIFARLAQPMPGDAADVAAATETAAGAAGGRAHADAVVSEGPVAAAVTVAGTGSGAATAAGAVVPAASAVPAGAAAVPASAPTANAPVSDGSEGAALPQVQPASAHDGAAAAAGSAAATADAAGATAHAEPTEASQAAEAAAPTGGVSGVSVSGGVLGGSRYSHGLASAREVLSFLIELIQRRADDGVGPVEDDFTVFGLQMVHRAVLAGGSRLEQHPQMLELLHRDLFAAMVAAVGRSPGLGTINGMCQVLLAIVQVLGDSSMVQVETMLENVLLRLADGKDGAGVEQQEAALEGLLDLCRCPGFLHAAFLSCDCRVDRADLFEDICGLVSKTAFPVAQKSLGPMHQISLEALLAVMAALSERLTRSAPQLQPSAALPYFVDVWSPICRGEEPAIPLTGTDAQRATASNSGATSTSGSTHAGAGAAPGAAAAAANGVAPGSRPQSRGALSASASGASLASASGAAAASAEAAARIAAFEKGLKLRCALAVEHFNKDYKKGFQFLQANKLLPELHKPSAPDAAAPAADAATSTSDANGAAGQSVNEDELALCIGHFLRVAPGLNKTTIGELLGEPDQFYLKVLDAFTSTFQFAALSFEAGIRMFLESFKLPGEAQKIDRIINCFGKHYYNQAPDVFRNEDAAYVLAYSVIMLNTDRHNNQVKQKMTQDGFRRNLRGVNGGEDFPQEFLDSIYASICRAPLRMTRDGAAANSVASGGGVSPSTWAALSQRARTSRGRTVALPPAERHCFDGFMFQVCWGPALHAMGVVLEHAETEATVRTALDGLKLACQVAAHFDIDGVADSAVLSLSKYSGALSPAVAKPRVVFGRDLKAPAATEALFYIITRYGDCIRTGWAPVMDLVLRLNQIDALPPALEELLDADAAPSPASAPQQPQQASTAAPASTSDDASAVGSTDGSSVQLDKASGAAGAAGASGAAGAPGGRRRRRRRGLGSSASSRALGVGGSFLRSVTQLMALQEPEYEAKVATQAEREYEALALEVLHSKCAIQDVFADSRFLRPEALEALIAAIIAAPGPLPRPAGSDKASSGSGANALGAPGTIDWESVELCLDLLMVVVLRNRDRLALLWPAVFDHLTAIIRGKGIDAGVLQSAATGVLRLCQRLLPYKPEAAEPLLRGLQLVPSLDPEVAWGNAVAIATEMLVLVKTAAPHIRVQWAWGSVCNLLKMTSVRPDAWPISLEAMTWLVAEGTTPLNFVLALDAAVWFVERAALEHPDQQTKVLLLIDTMASWMEGWCKTLDMPGLSQEQIATFAFAKSEFWQYLMEMLTKLSEHPDPTIRASIVATLQRECIGAERMGVLPATVERAMRERLLPPTEALTKKVAARSKDTPQADLTVRELIRAQTKLVLLYAPQLQQLQGFSALWQAMLSALLAAHVSGSEALSEAVPEALKNMLLVLHAKGTLQPGWCDAHGVDLWALTWKCAGRISSNLTPQMLMLTPTRSSSGSGHGGSAHAAPGSSQQSQRSPQQQQLQQQQQQQASQQHPPTSGAAEAPLSQQQQQQQQLPAIEVAAAAATVGT